MSLPNPSSPATPSRQQIVRDYLRLSRNETDELLVRRLDVERRRDNIISLAWDYGFSVDEIAKSLGMKIPEVAEIIAADSDL